MSKKYKFRDNDKLYFVSFAVVEWIDLFIRNEYKDIIIKSLEYCIKNKGLEVYGWCIMTSHMHLIIGSNKESLKDIIRDLKRYTSETLHKVIVQNKTESRREWMIKMMQEQGIKNSNNSSFQLW